MVCRSGRASHNCVIEEYIYMFGGVDWYTVYNDMWRFDLRTNTWQLVGPESVDLDS